MTGSANPISNTRKAAFLAGRGAGKGDFSLSIHSSLGLTLGMFMFLMSISGCLMVFFHELADATTPTIASSGNRSSFASVVASVRRVYPGYDVTWISNEPSPEEPLRVYAERSSRRVTVLVDPYSAEVVGELNQFLQLVRFFHFDLLDARSGRQVNAIAAVAVLVLAGSGLALWWRRGFRLKGLVELPGGSWQTMLRNAHASGGVWMLPLITIWAVSAIYFGFPVQFKTMLERILSASTYSGAPLAIDKRNRKAIQVTPDAAARVAIDQLPGHYVRWIRLPVTSRSYKVVLVPNDAVAPDETSTVEVDSNTGRVSSILSPEDRTLADTVILWLKRLHFGSFGGVPVKILWVVLGFMPAALFASGAVVWVNRRMALKRSRLAKNDGMAERPGEDARQ